MMTVLRAGQLDHFPDVGIDKGDSIFIPIPYDAPPTRSPHGRYKEHGDRKMNPAKNLSGPGVKPAPELVRDAVRGDFVSKLRMALPRQNLRDNDRTLTPPNLKTVKEETMVIDSHFETSASVNSSSRK
jgi:hypothetical protein